MIGASFEEATLCGRLMFHLSAALANSGVIWSESGPAPARRNVVGAAAAAADRLARSHGIWRLATKCGRPSHLTRLLDGYMWG